MKDEFKVATTYKFSSYLWCLKTAQLSALVLEIILRSTKASFFVYMSTKLVHKNKAL